MPHKAPKTYRVNRFHCIHLDGDFAYCESHRFVFFPTEEEKKLYWGQPCFYTDSRYTEGTNFFKSAYIRFNRKKSISLKSCIRKTLHTRNIPVGTIVEFQSQYWVPKKKINLNFDFKVKTQHVFDPQYQVNKPSFFRQLVSSDTKAVELVNRLREEGFLVKIVQNQNFLNSMVQVAGSYLGQSIEPQYEEGTAIVAFGYGKKIGFSTHSNTLFGYTYGIDSILWDNYGCFDKWSRCNEIPKTESIETIIEILKQ